MTSPPGASRAARFDEHARLGARRDEDHHVAGEDRGVERPGCDISRKRREIGFRPRQASGPSPRARPRTAGSTSTPTVSWPARGELDGDAPGAAPGVEDPAPLPAGEQLDEQRLHQAGFAVHLVTGRREARPPIVVGLTGDVDAPWFTRHSPQRRSPESVAASRRTLWKTLDLDRATGCGHRGDSRPDPTSRPAVRSGGAQPGPRAGRP